MILWSVYLISSKTEVQIHDKAEMSPRYKRTAVIYII